jgi:ABC-2 type transport system ATP-binding protein
MEQTKDMPMIKTENLSKVFMIGKKQKEELLAVDQLTLQIEEGEVFGFLGPNGAGKTTTVRMLTSLIRPSSGSAQVNGLTIGVDDTEIRHSVGILTESPGLYERLTAEQNLRIFAELYDIQDPEKAINKYLSMMGLWDRRMDAVGSYSKGMRQKLAVSRALLHEPKVLFLDEPTTGLDPEAAKIVRDFIEELKNQGRTIFMCTHNLDEAERHCDRVAIFNQKLLAVDKPSALREQLFGRKVVFHLAIVSPRMVLAAESVPGVKAVEQVDNKLVLSLEEPERLNPILARALIDADADILFIGEIKQSLERVYLDLIRNTESMQDKTRDNSEEGSLA